MATLRETPEANAIATLVAEKCCEFKKNGEPKAPYRYATIWQAARLGAIEAIKARGEA